MFREQTRLIVRKYEFNTQCSCILDLVWARILERDLNQSRSLPLSLYLKILIFDTNLFLLDVWERVNKCKSGWGWGRCCNFCLFRLFVRVASVLWQNMKFRNDNVHWTMGNYLTLESEICLKTLACGFLGNIRKICNVWAKGLRFIDIVSWRANKFNSFKTNRF